MRMPAIRGAAKPLFPLSYHGFCAYFLYITCFKGNPIVNRLMKKGCLYFLPAFFLIVQLEVTAQNNDLPVRFRAGNFITGNNIQRQSFQKNDLQPSLFNNSYYVLVQFSKLPSPETKRSLKDAGLELLNYVPGRCIITHRKNLILLSRVRKNILIDLIKNRDAVDGNNGIPVCSRKIKPFLNDSEICITGYIVQ